jgi:hypothetical protein
MFLAGGMSRLGINATAAGGGGGIFAIWGCRSFYDLRLHFCLRCHLVDSPFALLYPIMFNHIGEKTLYIFVISNVITIPMVWALCPESNQRTLEEMDLLFAAKTPWVWDAEKNFARLKAEHPEIARAAHSGKIVQDVETGRMGSDNSIAASTKLKDEGMEEGHSEDW